MIYTGNGVSGRFYLIPPLGSSDGTTDRFYFATQFTTYVDAETQIGGGCSRYPYNSGVGQCGATLSGHLESVP
jgi:hypothetical protein